MKFAAQISFSKEEEEITYLSGRLVSDYFNIESMMAGIEYDVFNPNVLEGEQIKTLTDGDYFAYLTGEIIVDYDEDHESGRTETSFIFVAEEEDIVITKLLRGEHEPKSVHRGNQHSQHRDSSGDVK